MSAQPNHTTDQPKALLRPFEWVPSQDQADTGHYGMLSNIRDLASGVALTLEIIERSQLNEACGGTPVIDFCAVQRLTRMSIVAMNFIEEMVDDHFDGLNNAGMDRRRAQKLREQQ